MKHVSNISLENMLRAFQHERNITGVRAVFRALGAQDVLDCGPAYKVILDGYCRWVEWSDIAQGQVVLREMMG